MSLNETRISACEISAHEISNEMAKAIKIDDIQIDKVFNYVQLQQGGRWRAQLRQRNKGEIVVGSKLFYIDTYYEVEQVEVIGGDEKHVSLILRAFGSRIDEPVVKHDIGWAVKKIREGCRITRTGWNGRNMWLGLRRPEGLQSFPTTIVSANMTQEFVYMKTAQGEYVPWLCSQTDLLSEDFEEVS
jgi:hypothetical protein